MLMIASLMVGSFMPAYASGDFRIRKPKLNRVPNYATSGLLMAVGWRLAARGSPLAVISQTYFLGLRCFRSTHFPLAQASSSAST
nr:YeeE/YedE thiosulfate transporter family protein [Haloquadratum walsbyi]